MKTILDFILASLFLILLWIAVTNGGEYMVFGLKVGLRSIKNPVILLTILGVIRLYFYTDTSLISHASKAYLWAIRGLLFFIVVVIGAKTFISLVSVYYFRLTLDKEDWLHTYSSDLSLAFIGLLLLALFGWWAGRNQTHRLLRVTLNCLLLVIGIVGIGAGILYILIAYTFFEWGSYIEPQHFEAMRNAGVGAEATDLLLRWRTLLAIAAIIGFGWLAHRLRQTIYKKSFAWQPITALLTILSPALLTANLPIQHPRKVAPSVQSPLLMLVRPVSGNMNGIDPTYLLGNLRHTKASYEPPVSGGNIKPAYQGLASVAKGQNVVFFIMESVRRRSLVLYGYDRETMPTLTKLADHAIVFDRAYVTQPRSSKAYTALALGVTPDPRLRPISWEPNRVTGKDTLIKRLMDDGRRYFIGTAQPKGSDDMEAFFNAASGFQANKIITRETLVANPNIPNHDQGMSLAFLDWAKQNQQPFVSLLWTQCAHMPYTSPIIPYGTNNRVDKYDNCLRSIDVALQTLVDGLAESDQLNNTLLVILGDHGEALGEKFDQGHGNYLYEHSLRIPLLMYNPLIENRIDVPARLQIKDIPSTVLYLLGLPDQINHSVNAFSKGPQDALFFSNVYQDFKLGLLEKQIKFVYRPTYDLVSMYDLETDPGENRNIANRFSPEAVARMKKQTILWYRHHTRNIDDLYPRKQN